MELIIEDKLLPEKKVRSLHAEASELVAIMAASCSSASRNKAISAKSAISNRQSEIHS